MPNENETEATQEDAQNAEESIFGDETPKLAAAAVEVQEAKDETGQEVQGRTTPRTKTAEMRAALPTTKPAKARPVRPRT